MDYFIKIGELAPLGLLTLVVVYLFKLLIRKVDNHDLDVALTPRWLVLVEQIIVTLIVSVVITLVVLLEMLDFFKVPTDNILEENGIYGLVSVLYIITIAILFFLWFYTKCHWLSWRNCWCIKFCFTWRCFK